ncbi:cytochrome c biogenesis protein ResB [Corynebacterium epidermidicanis]|uniref:Cytochrome C biosynthesis protein ResB n=1 Tax=Corynebacterium epidermidicanis TaxID=1050174 RepID=A0A0G3GSC1_9CORY|nr:cytochrome c biogenesis protein ResB [Corynebacterium epidermidicanis]AKK04034.1 cytochrome C biosynthesis protein ResB [Corynebacterium epidermidicanis]
MKNVKRLPLLAWRWLTSMRTALMLLFLLALGAIPGALLPQRSLNETKVDEYLAANGKLAEVYDKLQLFDVFSSTWFTAIYVLLFVSLIGCIIPRSWDHYQAWKTPPVRAPRNFERLPLHGSGVVEGDSAQVEASIRSALKGWRIAEYQPEDDRAGKHSFAAEKGYARELFNLVFHLGLVGVLLTVGFGKMVYYEGQVIVVAGAENAEFCNTAVANFDSFRAGSLVDGTQLDPFCVHVNDFSADYLPSGQAIMFTSNVDYAVGDDVFKDHSQWQKYQLKVNHPLRLAGSRVYLQGHGFAPRFTVKWPNGETRTQMVQFRPDDPRLFLSSGVMRFDPPAGMYPDLQERRTKGIAIQGLFAPTAAWSGEKGQLLQSAFPAMRDPAVAIDIYRGDAGLDSGRGQSIFSLDPSLLHTGALQKLERVNLKVGEKITLDDGTEVTFDGANEFANLQISHDPTQAWVLVTSLIMLGGLVGSLTVKRRRIWVRISPAAEGGTLVETAGLSRTDRAGWGAEYERIHRQLLGLPEPEDE